MIRRQHNLRSAFTLVEILVVIAIIAILAGLGAAAMFAMHGVQQRRNTESTIMTLSKLLQTRWAAVIAEAKQEPISAATHGQVFLLAGQDPDRARMIWIKVRLMEAFPESYAEIQQPTVLQAYIPAGKWKPHFTTYQQTLAQIAPNPPGVLGQTPGESGACLLLALRTLQAGGTSIDDQIKYAIAPSDNANPARWPGAVNKTPNLIPTLIDGRGLELAFFRFACGHAALQTNTPGNQLYGDPVDNLGKLISPTWYGAAAPPTMPSGQTYEKDFHKISDPALRPPQSGKLATLYSVPVIVSAGKDGKFGLNTVDVSGNDTFSAVAPPLHRDMSIASGWSFEADNIYSYQLTGN